MDDASTPQLPRFGPSGQDDFFSGDHSAGATATGLDGEDVEMADAPHTHTPSVPAGSTSTTPSVQGDGVQPGNSPGEKDAASPTPTQLSATVSAPFTPSLVQRPDVRPRTSSGDPDDDSPTPTQSSPTVTASPTCSSVQRDGLRHGTPPGTPASQPRSSNHHTASSVQEGSQNEDDFPVVVGGVRVDFNDPPPRAPLKAVDGVNADGSYVKYPPGTMEELLPWMSDADVVVYLGLMDLCFQHRLHGVDHEKDVLASEPKRFWARAASDDSERLQKIEVMQRAASKVMREATDRGLTAEQHWSLVRSRSGGKTEDRMGGSGHGQSSGKGKGKGKEKAQTSEEESDARRSSHGEGRHNPSATVPTRPNASGSSANASTLKAPRKRTRSHGDRSFAASHAGGKRGRDTREPGAASDDDGSETSSPSIGKRPRRNLFQLADSEMGDDRSAGNPEEPDEDDEDHDPGPSFDGPDEPCASEDDARAAFGRMQIKRVVTPPPPLAQTEQLQPQVRTALLTSLQILYYGANNPAAVADKGFFRLIPLEFMNSYRTDGPAQHSDYHPWLTSLNTLHQSHELTMSRTLQLFIDTAAFLETNRTTIHSMSTPAQKEEFKRMTEDFDFGELTLLGETQSTGGKMSDAQRKRRLKELKTIGHRVHGLCAVLGSVGFMVFLTMNSTISTLSRMLQCDQHVLVALSALLRGGRPANMDRLCPSDRRLAEAGVFGAQVVLPRVLNRFLASASVMFDQETDGLGDQAELALARATTCLHIGPVIESGDMWVYHPQPAIERTEVVRGEDGDEEEDEAAFRRPKKSIALGMMTGYGQPRRTITAMPTWKLTKNYSKFTAEVSRTQAKKSLDDIFPFGGGKRKKGRPDGKPDVPEGMDPEFPASEWTPNVSYRMPYHTATSMVASYREHFSIPESDPSMQEIMKSVEAEELLVGPVPPAPTHPYLRSRGLHQEALRLRDDTDTPEPEAGPSQPSQTITLPGHGYESDDD